MSLLRQHNFESQVTYNNRQPGVTFSGASQIYLVDRIHDKQSLVISPSRMYKGAKVANVAVTGHACVPARAKV